MYSKYLIVAAMCLIACNRANDSGRGHGNPTHGTADPGTDGDRFSDLAPTTGDSVDMTTVGTSTDMTVVGVSSVDGGVTDGNTTGNTDSAVASNDGGTTTGTGTGGGNGSNGSGSGTGGSGSGGSGGGGTGNGGNSGGGNGGGPPPCGGVGQACCVNNTCNNSLVCYDGTCYTNGPYCPSGDTLRVNCASSPGYFKTHACWAETYVTLGTVVYSPSDVEAILSAPDVGNGLTTLGRELATTKLNVADGADCSSLGTAVQDADAMIGSLVVLVDYLDPALTSALAITLDNFNNGLGSATYCQ